MHGNSGKTWAYKKVIFITFKFPSNVVKNLIETVK